MRRDNLTVRVTTFDEVTGEQREWWTTPRIMRLIVRALGASRYVPEYITDRFRLYR